MITLLQRVSRASVSVDNEVVAEIARGLLLFVGVEQGDTEADADTTARKIAAMRIFPAETGKPAMDRTVLDVTGACLVVSQFTLAGRIYKGNRPSFDRAESPERADALYRRVGDQLLAAGIPVQTGRFAAHMDVHLINDGPVTFVIEVKNGTLIKR